MPEDIIWVGSGFFGLIHTQRQHNDGAPFGQFGENGKIRCFGRSESLDVGGRGEEDDILIRSS